MYKMWRTLKKCEEEYRHLPSLHPSESAVNIQLLSLPIFSLDKKKGNNCIHTHKKHTLLFLQNRNQTLNTSLYSAYSVLIGKQFLLS